MRNFELITFTHATKTNKRMVGMIPIYKNERRNELFTLVMAKGIPKQPVPVIDFIRLTAN